MVTAADVIALTRTKLPELVVESVIADAQRLATPCAPGWDAQTEESIVKWLAAHMIASVTGGDSATVSSRKLGDASRSYSVGQLGKGLESTFYGQQALLLDSTGCLQRLGKPRATFEVV